MKKKVLILMIGILLIGVNAYAAGDLVVNGKMAVGTSPTDSKLEVVGTDLERSVKIVQQIDNIYYPPATWISANYGQNITDDVSLYHFIGQKAAMSYQGSATTGAVGSFTGLQAQIGFLSANDTVITDVIGFDSQLLGQTGNAGDHTITTYKGVSLSSSMAAGTGSFGGTDWYQFYIADFVNMGGTVTNQYGLYIENIGNNMSPTNRAGIALVGDGAGSDIVFGASQQIAVSGTTGGDLAVNGGGVVIDNAGISCLMLRDTDDAGWTECNALNGVLSCSTDSDGVCDGS